MLGQYGIAWRGIEVINGLSSDLQFEDGFSSKTIYNIKIKDHGWWTSAYTVNAQIIVHLECRK